MITVIFLVCTAGGTFCEEIRLPVPVEHMTPLYCQMRGGLETAQLWITRNPAYRIAGRVRCVDGLQS